MDIKMLWILVIIFFTPLEKELYLIELPTVEITSYTTQFSKNLIMSLEKCALESFEDYGRYSIGYGTKSYPGEKITATEALKRFERYWNREFKKLYWINYEQRLIFVSLLYNTGYIGPDLKKAIVCNDYCKIENEYLRYNKAQGKVLNGLTYRRNLELYYLEKIMK